MAKWTLRIVCLVLLVGIAYVGYRIWERKQPGYLWTTAQAATKKGDHTAARIELKNLVAQEPENAPAQLKLAEELLHEALAANRAAAAKALLENGSPEAAEKTKTANRADLDALLREKLPPAALDKAKAAEKPDTYAEHREALSHLAEAARLLPKDADVQKQLLAAYIRQGNLQAAAAPAKRLEKLEDKNSDALFVLAAEAVRNSNTEAAEKLFERLEQTKSRHVFQIFALQAELHRSKDNKEKLQKSLAGATDLASKLTPDQWKLLTVRDVDAFEPLSLAAVQLAPDAESAVQRAERILAASEQQLLAFEKRLPSLSRLSAQLMLVLGKQHPALLVAADDGLPARHKALAARSLALGEKAIAAGGAPMVVYYASAEGEFTNNNSDGGFKIIDAGLKVAEQAGDKASEVERAGALQLRLLAARQLVVQRKYREAEKHIPYLLSDKQFGPWGHLLQGSSASSEGKFEQALEEYQKAQTTLGNTLLIRMALADTLIRLGRWQQALPHLTSLHVSFRQLNPEERAWAEQHLGSEDRVHLNELRCKLSLGKWTDAQSHLQALKSTSFAPQAWFMAVAYLWQANEKSQAMATLAEARRQFPTDLPLVRLETALMEQSQGASAAEKSLEQFVFASPQDLRRQLLLAQWRLQHRKPADALKALDSVDPATAGKPDERVLHAALKTQALWALNRNEEALELVASLKADPQTSAAAGILGVAFELKDNDLEGAWTEMEAAIKQSPDNPGLGFLKGQLAASRGQHEQAIDALSKSLDVTMFRDQARTAILDSLLKMARQSPDKADGYLDPLMEKYPSDPLLFVAKAETHLARGKTADALAALDKVEQLQPKGALGPYLKSMVKLQTSGTAEAEFDIRRALALEPKNLQCLLLAGQIALGERRPSEALDHADAMLAVKPSLPLGQQLRAEALRRMARYPEAITTLRVLLSEQPNYAKAYHQLAEVQEAAGSTDDALGTYREAKLKLAKDPTFAIGEIRLLAKGGQMAEAKAMADKLAGNEAEAARYLMVSGAFAGAGKLDEAIAWGQRGLEVANPADLAGMHFHLGNLKLQLGLPEKLIPHLEAARDHYAKVLDEHPKHYVAGNNLAWLLASEFNQPAKALEIAERVRGELPVEKLPEDFLDTIALAHRKAGQPEKAVEVMDAALKVKARQPKLLFQRGMALVELKRSTEARTTLQMALQADLRSASKEAADEAVEAIKQLESPGTP